MEVVEVAGLWGREQRRSKTGEAAPHRCQTTDWHRTVVVGTVRVRVMFGTPTASLSHHNLTISCQSIFWSEISSLSEIFSVIKIFSSPEAHISQCSAVV